MLDYSVLLGTLIGGCLVAAIIIKVYEKEYNIF